MAGDSNRHRRRCPGGAPTGAAGPATGRHRHRGGRFARVRGGGQLAGLAAQLEQPVLGSRSPTVASRRCSSRSRISVASPRPAASFRWSIDVEQDRRFIPDVILGECQRSRNSVLANSPVSATHGQLRLRSQACDLRWDQPLQLQKHPQAGHVVQAQRHLTPPATAGGRGVAFRSRSSVARRDSLGQ